MNRIIFILLGTVWAIFGLSIIINPKFYSDKYHRYFDFTGYNIPFGIILIIIGGLFIWTTLKKSNK